MLKSDEVAHFIVTQGGWERTRYGAFEGRGFKSLRLEGITQGKQELIAEVEKLMPVTVLTVTDKVSTEPSDLRGRGDVVLTVDEKDLRRVRKEKSSTVWRTGGQGR